MKRLLLRWLAAMALSLGAALLGIRFGAGIPAAAAWHMGLFLFQLACIIVSPLLGLRWLRKLERLDFLKKCRPDEARREAQAHQRSRIHPKQIRRWTVMYLAALTASALAGSFFCGASGKGIGTTQLLSLYVLYGMTGRVHRPENLRFDDEAAAVWTSLALVLPRKRLQYDAEVDALLSRDNQLTKEVEDHGTSHSLR